MDGELPDDEAASGDDYDRNEDFDGDFQDDAAALTLKTGSEELEMDYAVWGKYVEGGLKEGGKPTFQGPKSEGKRASIAFQISPDGKPTWWIYDQSSGECFYAEVDSDRPPKTGWRKEYGDEDLDITLEGGAEGGAAKKGEEGKERARSRSPRRGPSAAPSATPSSARPSATTPSSTKPSMAAAVPVGPSTSRPRPSARPSAAP